MRERGGLRVFQRLAGRTLVALDGTEYFCSQKLSCPQFLTRKGANWPKKGGVGYFLPKVPRMLLIWLMLMGCTLVCFARFCDTFRDVLARVERCGRGFGKGKDKDGPALVVFHPCLANSKYGQGHGKGRAPGRGVQRTPAILWRPLRFFGYFDPWKLISRRLILLCAIWS